MSTHPSSPHVKKKSRLRQREESLTMDKHRLDPVLTADTRRWLLKNSAELKQSMRFNH
jgi:hypothetical protein